MSSPETKEPGGLILAVPSKGRLQENAHNFFSRAGFDVRQARGSRDYVGQVKGIDNVKVRYLSASEIARELARGTVHIGVTGEDLVREGIPDHERVVTSILKLGFGHARVVIAVPEAWIDVVTMDDLEDVANRMRQSQAGIIRVATKYVTLTREFFAKAGLGEQRDYRIVESAGATEGAPAAGTADIIVDITSSGATLAANRLRVLDDGEMLASEANLFLSQRAQWTDVEKQALEALLIRIEAEQRAQQLREIRCVFTDTAKDDLMIEAFYTEFEGVELAQAAGETIYLHVAKKKVFEIVDYLRANGGDHITVRQLDYIFPSKSSLFERVAPHLNL